MGKLSDLLGRRPVFLLGLSLATLSSVLAPLSPTFGWLIGFRIIQAIGSSSMFYRIDDRLLLVFQEEQEGQVKAV